MIDVPREQYDLSVELRMALEQVDARLQKLTWAVVDTARSPREREAASAMQASFQQVRDALLAGQSPAQIAVLTKQVAEDLLQRFPDEISLVAEEVAILPQDADSAGPAYVGEERELRLKTAKDSLAYSKTMLAELIAEGADPKQCARILHWHAELVRAIEEDWSPSQLREVFKQIVLAKHQLRLPGGGLL